MKRLITFLIAIFIAHSATGQIVKTKNQASEPTISDRFSILHKKAITEGTNRIVATPYTAKVQSKTTLTNDHALDSLLTEQWNDNANVWEPGIREQFTYDANDRVEEAILSIWYANTMQWQVFKKDEFTFDTNGNLTEHLIYYQYIPGAWNLSSKTEYTYDGNNNLTLEEEFYWDSVGNVWNASYKYELSYDTNQNLILDIGYEWLSNQWNNSYMDEYFYTSNVLSSEINSLWNYGTNQWDYDKQSLYTITAGKVHMEVIQEWNSFSDEWDNAYKSDYVYNTNGSLDYETYSAWDSNLMQWDFWKREDYQYDGNGNRTVHLRSEWLGNPGAWVEYYKDEYVHDLSYDLANISVPFFYLYSLEEENAFATNMVIGYFGFEKENQQWVDTDKWLFHYSNYSNPLLQVSEHELATTLKMYPNPARRFLIVESDVIIDKIEIFSLSGTKVKEVRTDFNAIPIYDIANGLYIVKITSGMQFVSKQIIKQ